MMKDEFIFSFAIGIAYAAMALGWLWFATRIVQ